MTEMEDYLSYVGDVIEVANPRLRSEVSRKFWDGFVEPIVVGPLLAANVRLLTHCFRLCCGLHVAVIEAGDGPVDGPVVMRWLGV